MCLCATTCRVLRVLHVRLQATPVLVAALQPRPPVLLAVVVWLAALRSGR